MTAFIDTVPELGTNAPTAGLLRPDGAPVRLQELLGERPTVLFFLRHYG